MLASGSGGALEDMGGLRLWRLKDKGKRIKDKGERLKDKGESGWAGVLFGIGSVELGSVRVWLCKVKA